MNTTVEGMAVAVAAVGAAGGAEGAPGPEQMRAAAGRALAALRLLANEDRLLLLCALAKGEQSVGQLQEGLGIRQPTLSQQLAVLRQDGVVDVRRDGRHMIYRVADPAIQELLGVLYRLYCPAGPAAGADPPAG